MAGNDGLSCAFGGDSVAQMASGGPGEPGEDAEESDNDQELEQRDAVTHAARYAGYRIAASS